MMRDLSTETDARSKLAKTGKLTTIGGAAAAVIIMQFVAFGIFMDLVTSVVLVGIGYGARMWTERR